MSRSILVADDDAGVRRLLQVLLSREGYRVEAVESGRAALVALFGSQRSGPHGYRLLITDLEMPGRTGLEVIAEVRSRGDRLPVLLLSGSFREGDLERARGLERVSCLWKPFGIPEMREALDRALSEVESSPESAGQG